MPTVLVETKVRSLLTRLNRVTIAMASEPDTFRQLHLLHLKARLSSQLGRLIREANHA